jgi:hypothetical protein
MNDTKLLTPTAVTSFSLWQTSNSTICCTKMLNQLFNCQASSAEQQVSDDKGINARFKK